MEYVDNMLSNEAGILYVLALSVWRYFAGDKAAGIERRIEQCVRAAMEKAFAAARMGGIEPEAVLAHARKLARENIQRLGLPMKETTLVLVEHFLDVLAAEHAADARKANDATLAALAAVKIPTVDELRDEWAEAEKQGRALVTGDKPELTILKPDEPMPP